MSRCRPWGQKGRVWQRAVQERTTGARGPVTDRCWQGPKTAEKKNPGGGWGGQSHRIPPIIRQRNQVFAWFVFSGDVHKFLFPKQMAPAQVNCSEGGLRKVQMRFRSKTHGMPRGSNPSTSNERAPDSLERRSPSSAANVRGRGLQHPIIQGTRVCRFVHPGF